MDEVDHPGPADGAAANSSPSETPSPSPSPTPSSPPAETSAGDISTGQSKESLLDAVLKVVPATNEKDVLDPSKDKAAPPDAAQLSSEDQAKADEADEGPDDDEPPPPETAPAVRKKINKLLRQRRELRAELSELQGPAQIGSELQNFASANNLSGDDVTNTLRIAAMARAGDYQGFYEAIGPMVRRAQEYLGIVLPKDVAARVKQGQMTEQAAREFARQRFDAQRSDVEREAAEVARQQHVVRSVQADVKRVVSQFELRLGASDPDYKAKAPAVRRAAQAMLLERGGAINSVEEALQITQAAYDEVNKHFRSFQPRPVATAPKPNGATQTPSARQAPKSLMEAALQGLENSRRAGG
jgi:hypothetical protein